MHQLHFSAFLALYFALLTFKTTHFSLWKLHFCAVKDCIFMHLKTALMCTFKTKKRLVYALKNCTFLAFKKRMFSVRLCTKKLHLLALKNCIFSTYKQQILALKNCTFMLWKTALLWLSNKANYNLPHVISKKLHFFALKTELFYAPKSRYFSCMKKSKQSMLLFLLG